MKSKMFGIISSILFVVATLVSSTACFFLFYQPKTPKALDK
ncbi:cyclic lactone autoinducer peptide [Herbivorax sp. ANBcel31]|nr:cyclic lactone autoinducer peptide [Herbivorax sp. ANBcel31]MDQ2088204.1 cyclic lactone autoinducer peptide [Herbivorax sp. ANBcel31]